MSGTAARREQPVRGRGRPAKDGTRIGAQLPADLVDAANDWISTQGLKPGEGVEALLMDGLALVPAGHAPIPGYKQGKKYIWGYPAPELYAKVHEPVSRNETSMTRRMLRLLHYALLAKGYDLPNLTSAGQQLKKTGTNG